MKNQNIKECAVIAKDDEKWGEIVVAAITVNTDSIETKELQEWCSKYLSDYKIPRIIKVLDQLPKNSMGKVTKKELKELTLDELKKFNPKFTSDVLSIFELKNSINSKKSFGGTSFSNIKKMIVKYKKNL